MREAMSVLRHREDAEEAAQEAMLRSWRRADQCRGDEFGPWTRQITRNEALRVVARRRRSEFLPGELPDRGVPDPELERMPVTDSVRAALRQLKRSDQVLVALRYGEDLTQGQVARVLGVPEGTVKIRLHRARTQMRALLA